MAGFVAACEPSPDPTSESLEAVGVLAEADDAAHLAAVQKAFDLIPYGRDLERQIYAAVQGDVRSCMESSGFSYPELPAPPSAPIELIDAIALFPDVPTQPEIEESGYEAFMFSPLGELGSGSDASDAILDAIDADPAYGETLASCSDAASAREADLSEYRAEEIYRSVFLPRFFSIKEEVAADPRVQSTIEAWVACMSQKGHVVADPHLQVREMSAKPKSVAATRLAIDDAACRAMVGLREIELEVAAEYVDSVLAENATQLVELQEFTRSEAQGIVLALEEWNE